ncbi:MAG: flagellar hook-basal body complex protein FliE [Candidatus Azotimanducaceae bacterium]|jgi:flagellar hook-basal body complex protein FliE
MDINAISAIQKYAASKPATDPDVDGVKDTTFGKIAMDFAQTLAKSEMTAKQAMIGDADPHALVQALAQTELAVETAVTVRNKVIEAYQEILRMPV